MRASCCKTLELLYPGNLILASSVWAFCELTASMTFICTVTKCLTVMCLVLTGEGGLSIAVGAGENE